MPVLERADTLDRLSPVVIVVLVGVVLVRRMQGERVDLRDALVVPALLLFFGIRSILELSLTTVDIVWLVIQSIVGFGFGVWRATTTVWEHRDGVLYQRYRWRTVAILVLSLVVGGALSLLAQVLGMNDAARPITLALGVGLAGEGLITLARAHLGTRVSD